MGVSPSQLGSAPPASGCASALWSATAGCLPGYWLPGLCTCILAQPEHQHWTLLADSDWLTGSFGVQKQAVTKANNRPMSRSLARSLAHSLIIAHSARGQLERGNSWLRGKRPASSGVSYAVKHASQSGCRCYCGPGTRQPAAGFLVSCSITAGWLLAAAIDLPG